MSISDYPRTPSGFDQTDPVTLTPVDIGQRYYIRANVTKRKEIKHVYHKDTLERILNGHRHAASPMTRTMFTKHDIARAPDAGFIHPDLEGKKLQMVLRSKDTKNHVGPRLKVGQRADILMREGGNSLTIKKIGGNENNREFRVNVTLSVNVVGDKGLSNILDAISGVVENSVTMIHVESSRVVRETKSSQYVKKISGERYGN